jgi:hypothetical protein
MQPRLQQETAKAALGARTRGHPEAFPRQGLSTFRGEPR